MRLIVLGGQTVKTGIFKQPVEGPVLAGPEGLVRLVAESGADLVLNAIVGAAGLRSPPSTSAMYPMETELPSRAPSPLPPNVHSCST